MGFLKNNPKIINELIYWCDHYFPLPTITDYGRPMKLFLIEIPNFDIASYDWNMIKKCHSWFPGISNLRTLKAQKLLIITSINAWNPWTHWNQKNRKISISKFLHVLFFLLFFNSSCDKNGRKNTNQRYRMLKTS